MAMRARFQGAATGKAKARLTPPPGRSASRRSPSPRLEPETHAPAASSSDPTPPPPITGATKERSESVASVESDVLPPPPAQASSPKGLAVITEDSAAALASTRVQRKGSNVSTDVARGEEEVLLGQGPPSAQVDLKATASLSIATGIDGLRSRKPSSSPATFRKLIHQVPFLVRQLEAGLYVVKRTSMYLGKIVELNKSHLRHVDQVTHHEVEKEPDMKRDAMAAFVSSFLEIRDEVVQRTRDQTVFFHRITDTIVKPLGEWHRKALGRLSAIQRTWKQLRDEGAQVQKRLERELDAVQRQWATVLACSDTDRDTKSRRFLRAEDRLRTAKRKYRASETSLNETRQKLHRRTIALVDSMQALEEERLALLAAAFDNYRKNLKRLVDRAGSGFNEFKFVGSVEPKQCFRTTVKQWERVYGKHKGHQVLRVPLPGEPDPAPAPGSERKPTGARGAPLPSSFRKGRTNNIRSIISDGSFFISNRHSGDWGRSFQREVAMARVGPASVVLRVASLGGAASSALSASRASTGASDIREVFPLLTIRARAVVSTTASEEGQEPEKVTGDWSTWPIKKKTTVSTSWKVPRRVQVPLGGGAGPGLSRLLEFEVMCGDAKGNMRSVASGGVSIDDFQTKNPIEIALCRSRGGHLPLWVERVTVYKPVKKVYLVRHAESLWNKAQRNKDIVGLLKTVDHELTRDGVEQALALAEKIELAKNAPEQDTDLATADFLAARVVYSSPLARALQTTMAGLYPHPMFAGSPSSPETPASPISAAPPPPPGEGKIRPKGQQLECVAEEGPTQAGTTTSPASASSSPADTTRREKRQEKYRKHKAQKSLDSTKKRLVLLPTAREKRNIGSRDTTSTSRGDAVVRRALQKLPGAPDNLVSGSSVFRADVWKSIVSMTRFIDAADTTDEWWSESQEEAAEVTQRMRDLMQVLQYDDHENIIVVGHSHFFRELFKKYLSKDFETKQPQVASDLKFDVLSNCSVIQTSIAWDRQGSALIKDVRLLFGSRFAGKNESLQSVKRTKDAGSGEKGVMTHWKRDEDVDACERCEKTFRLGIRRHHCRHCGEIFCNECSSHRLPVKKFGYNAPVRVCDSCYALLTVRSFAIARVLPSPVTRAACLNVRPLPLPPGLHVVGTPHPTRGVYTQGASFAPQRHAIVAAAQFCGVLYGGWGWPWTRTQLFVTPPLQED